MGVPGLWDLLRPAAARASLSSLTREAVTTNKNGLRAFTIGIDASIWIFHAQVPTHGENPFLRTIFYKITSLLQQPVLPVFVFDGPDKPRQKRNQVVAGYFGSADSRSREFKQLLDECGLEWWNAPGEAEAELAIMNKQGKIDAVLSDDADALLFGATCLLRNNSPTLVASKANPCAAGQYEVFRSSAIRDLWTSKEGTSLVTEEDCRMAMVLIALMAGGDYVPEGLDQFGPTIALALAHAGFSDALKMYATDPEGFKKEMGNVHQRMVEELRTNSTGHLGRRYTDRANKLAQRDPSVLFPQVALDAYLTPSTSSSISSSSGWPGFGQGERSIRRGKAVNEGRGDLEGFARACERFFEWGTKDIVIKKFAGETVGAFKREIVLSARNSLLAHDVRASATRKSVPSSSPPSSQGTTSRISTFFPVVHPTSSSQSARGMASAIQTRKPDHIIKIHSTREDPVDPGNLEYRLSYEHALYSRRVRAAMEGNRVDPKDLTAAMRAEIGLVDVDASKDKDKDKELAQVVRCWVPDYLVKSAWPDLVEAWEGEVKAKEARDAAKAAKEREKAAGKKVKSGVGATVHVGLGMENRAAFEAFFTRDKQSAAATAVARATVGDGQKKGSKITTKATKEQEASSSDLTSDFESSQSSLQGLTVGPGRSRASPIKGRNRRLRSQLTSSISSAASLEADLTTPTTRRKARGTRRQSGSGVSPLRTESAKSSSRDPSPSATSRSASKASVLKKSPVKKSKGPIEVIDLVSSDEETPKASRTASNRPAKVLSPTFSRANVTVTEADKETRHTSPKKTRAVQSRLDLPVVAPSSSPIGMITPVKARKDTAKRGSGKKAKERYIVLSETDDEEHIDATGA